MNVIYYDTERKDRLSEQPWFECAKCGKHVTESDWLSLCQDCGEQEDDLPLSLTRKKDVLNGD